MTDDEKNAQAADKGEDQGTTTTQGAATTTQGADKDENEATTTTMQGADKGENQDTPTTADDQGEDAQGDDEKNAQGAEDA